MHKIVNVSWVWGPLATVAFTAIYHYGVQRDWYEASLATIFLFVVAGAFVSGVWGGLLAASWGGGYAIYLDLPSTRLVQVVLAMYTVAFLVGYGTHRLRKAIIAEFEAKELAEENQMKAQIFDGLTNGNVKVFVSALDILDGLRLGWETIPDNTRLAMVGQARGKLADLITLAKGFEEMARQRGYVVEHYGPDDELQ